MGRIPTQPLGLGIDYGDFPESQFSSSGARMYARQGNMAWAYAYEELCKIFRMPAPTTDEEYLRRSKDRRIIGSIFGEAEPAIVEQIQIECDPTYDPGEPNTFPPPSVYETLQQRRSVRAWGQGGRPMTSSWARRARPVPVRPAPPRTLPNRSIPARVGPVRTAQGRGFFSPLSPWMDPLSNTWT